MRLQHRTPVPACRQRRRPPHLLERAHPTDRARNTDPENPGRLVPRKAIFNDSLDHPNAKSLSMCHPRPLPHGRKDESCFGRFGKPGRFNSTPTRSSAVIWR